MAEYFDTAQSPGGISLGPWLTKGIRDPSCSGLFVQTAWFRFGAIEHLTEPIARLAASHAPVQFVIGSNEGDLPAHDLRLLWELVGSGSKAAITVVRFENATFHPKTFVTTSSTGQDSALVGSSNLTGRGTEWNIEAGLVLRSPQDESTIRQIISATERWKSMQPTGCFPVNSPQDVEILTTDSIIDVSQPKRTKTTIKNPATEAAGTSAVPAASRFWRPPQPVVHSASTNVGGNSATVLAVGTTASWSKVLSNSDAQQTKPGTNPTGKLRLTKSTHDIDPRSWFRAEFFETETWETEVRKGGMSYELATIEFDVTISGENHGHHALVVDHALHRVAGQANIPTVLAWGSDIGRVLVNSSHAQKLLTITRTKTSIYKLDIM